MIRDGIANLISWRQRAMAAPIVLAVGLGVLSLTGHAPSVSISDHKSVTPASGELTLTGYAPSLFAVATTDVSPGAGSLTLTGAADRP